MVPKSNVPPSAITALRANLDLAGWLAHAFDPHGIRDHELVGRIG
jgi:hypothetical protein